MRPFLFALAVSTLLLGQGVVQYAPKVDPNLPPYVGGQAVDATIEVIGSDSLTDVWEEWKTAFLAVQPKARFKVTQTLSTISVKALMDGMVPLIHLPRELSPAEYQAFEKKYGYPPTKLVVCFDAFIVFVNKGNPIKEIGMDQLDAAYSTTHLAGYRKDLPVETWGDLGVRGDYAARPIHPYMRAEGTAARGTLRELLLLKGQYKPSVKDTLDWPGITEGVMTDASGIGIATLANWLVHVKVLPVAPLQTKEAVSPNQENVVTGRYPLARTYYFYLNREPGKALPGPLLEFLHFLYSREGQAAVTQASIYPLPADIAQIYRKRLRSN